jgi:hypothetical protein
LGGRSKLPLHHYCSNRPSLLGCCLWCELSCVYRASPVLYAAALKYVLFRCIYLHVAAPKRLLAACDRQLQFVTLS